MVALADASGACRRRQRCAPACAAMHCRGTLAPASSLPHALYRTPHRMPAGMPVAVMLNSKGLFPEDHPNFIGLFWASLSRWWGGPCCVFFVCAWLCASWVAGPPSCPPRLPWPKHAPCPACALPRPQPGHWGNCGFGGCLRVCWTCVQRHGDRGWVGGGPASLRPGHAACVSSPGCPGCPPASPPACARCVAPPHASAPLFYFFFLLCRVHPHDCPRLHGGCSGGLGWAEGLAGQRQSGWQCADVCVWLSARRAPPQAARRRRQLARPRP